MITTFPFVQNRFNILKYSVYQQLILSDASEQQLNLMVKQLLYLL